MSSSKKFDGKASRSSIKKAEDKEDPHKNKFAEDHTAEMDVTQASLLSSFPSTQATVTKSFAQQNMQTPSAEPSLFVQRTQASIAKLPSKKNISVKYTINEVEKEDVTQVDDTVPDSREFHSSVATPKMLVNQKGAGRVETKTTEATSIDKVTTNEETAVLLQNSPTSVIKTAEIAGNSPYKTAISKAASKISVTVFDPTFKNLHDVYPIMLVLDLVCVAIVCFGYSEFIPSGHSDIWEAVSENNMKMEFVFLLIFFTICVLIDRVIYLRRSVVCKCVFMFAVFVFINFWLIALPLIQQRTIMKGWMPKCYYIMKCFYLFASGWQVYKGYVTLTMTHFEKQTYGVISRIMNKLYVLIPFLFELTTTVDWVATDSALGFHDFYNMENFYNIIYSLKCKVTWEKHYPDSIGKAKSKWFKCAFGVPLLLLVVLIIWSPMLAFSIVNFFGTDLALESARLRIRIEGYPPLYEMRAEGQEDLVTLTFDHGSPARKWMEKFTKGTKIKRDDSEQARAFFLEYKNKGVIRVRFQPESEIPWQLSAENMESLKNVLSKNKNELNLRMIVEIEFRQMRLSPMKDPRMHSLSYAIPIRSELRKSFLDILNTDLANATTYGLFRDGASLDLVIPYALPNFVIVQNEGEVLPAKSLLDAAIEQNTAEVEKECQCNSTYNDLNMKIAIQDSNIYWTATMIPNSGLVKRELNFDPMTVKLGMRHDRYLEVFAFVDRAFPKNVPAYVVNGGIIGMYIVVVLTFGQLTRKILANAPHVVPVDKTPNPDRLLLLCHEIYLAREVKDFSLEQKLFSRLIVILRSNVVFMQVTEEEAT